MEIITSLSNEKVKLIRKLDSKKFRRETGLFVAEGINILKDLPDCAEVESFLVTEAAYPALKEAVGRSGAPCFIVTQQVMENITGTVTPAGAVAAVKIPRPQRRGGNLLLLDGVSDPGNLGALIRTAAAAGFLDVLLINCADAYSGKTVRATMGGIFKVNIYESGLEDALDILAGYDSYAMDMRGSPVNGFKPLPPVAVALGSEAHGLSQEVLSACKHRACLPMLNGMESLNVAAAGAVAMYNLSVFKEV